MNTLYYELIFNLTYKIDCKIKEQIDENIYIPNFLHVIEPRSRIGLHSRSTLFQMTNPIVQHISSGMKIRSITIDDNILNNVMNRK